MQRGPGPLEARAVDAKWGIDPGQGEACKVGMCVCVSTPVPKGFGFLHTAK